MQDMLSQEQDLVLDKIEELKLSELDREELEKLAATWYLRLAAANEFINLSTEDAKQQEVFYRKLMSEMRALQRSEKASGMIGLAHSIGKSNQKTLAARNSVRIKLANDPKQAEKDFVKDCWDAWQKSPGAYKSKAAFARDMLDKCAALTSNKVIEDWCRGWESESKT